MLRIDPKLQTSSQVVYSVTGSLTADHLPEVEALVGEAVRLGQEITFDLEGVWLVAREAVSFFSAGAGQRVHLLHAPAYLRQWLKCEGREEA